MRLITGIDTAMPDIRNGWSYHAEWNQNDRLWRDDFVQLHDLGFDLLRWGMPWSLVQPEPGVYRWELIDSKVEQCQKLGMEIFFPIVHFNYPKWVARPGELHAVLSERLPDALAEYTHRLLERYRFRLVIPIVEVQMDALQRGRWGKWQPHLTGGRSYRRIWNNLVKAFRAASAAAREHGATVVCSEPAPDIATVLALGDAVDIAGIDLYPHMHRRRSINGYFRQWWELARKPLCLSEFGTPESYDPARKRDSVGRFIQAGTDHNRVQEARILREALAKASEEGIPIPLGGWYPGTGNIGWGYALTRDRSDCDCDRAGLVDLSRQSDGSLRRVLCRELAEEVLGLRDLMPQQHALAVTASTGFSAASAIPAAAM